MKIGIIIAMDIEYRQMLDVLGGKPQGTIAGNEITLLQCGIGKVNAAIGTLNLINEHKPDCILSTGLAGGIDARLNVWDTVVASQTAYHDVYCGMGCEEGQIQGLPTRFESYKLIVDTVMKQFKPEGDTKFMEGLICTGDQFITDVEPLKAIEKKFPDVLACDMESAAIAHTCFLKKVPFASIRIISDTPGRTNNHAMQWEDSLRMMSGQSFHIVNELLKSL